MANRLLSNIQAFQPLMGAYQNELRDIQEERMMPLKRRAQSLANLQAQAKLDYTPFEKLIKLADLQERIRKGDISQGNLDAIVDRLSMEEEKQKLEREAANRDQRARTLSMLHDMYTSDGQIISPERLKIEQQKYSNILGDEPLTYEDLYRGSMYTKRFLGDKFEESKRDMDKIALSKEKQALEKNETVRKVYQDHANYVKKLAKEGQEITPQIKNQIRQSLIASGLSPEEAINFNADNPAFIAAMSDTVKPSSDGKVQAAKKYADGTVVQPLKEGGRLVYDPTGKLVKGEEARKVIDEANNYEVALEARREDATLSRTEEQDIRDSSSNAQVAGQDASLLSDLKDSLSGLKNNWGVFSTMTDWLVDAVGGEYKPTEIRRKYSRVRNKEVVEALPAGTASDADVALMLKGFPPPGSGVGEIKRFVDAASRVYKRAEEYHKFRSDWLANKKSYSGMIDAWKEREETIKLQDEIEKLYGITPPGE